MAAFALVMLGAGPAEAADGSASASPQASAETDRNQSDIVVTAEKREQTVQSLPVAIMAVTGSTLAERRITTIEDLRQIAPSLQGGFKIGGTELLSMRGIGSQLYNLAAEPAVSVSVDGVVYTSQNALNLNLFDVDRVEVLRGPQGTISGRNATAGAINIISKRPTDVLEGGIEATAGNFNRQAIEAYLSGPIIGDRLLARVAVRNDRADGWLDNTLLGQKLGKIDLTQVRATLLGRITDDLTATLIFENTTDNSDPVFIGNGRVRPDVPSLEQYYGVPAFDWSNRTIQQDVPTNTHVNSNQGTLRLDWAFSPSLKLSAITSIVDFKYHSITDQFDGTAVPAGVYDPQHPLTFPVKQQSQELTLTGDLGRRLDFIAGFFYLHNDLNQSAGRSFPLLGTHNFSQAHQELTSYAGYGQLRYRLTDSLTAIAGVRYTDDTKTYLDTSATASGPANLRAKASWHAWTPRFTLQYSPDAHLTIYATVAKGFKSGGFLTFSSPIQQFDPEKVWNYEMGIKGSTSDGRLQGALTGFYMDYRDLQQGIYTFNANGISSGVLASANTATIKGIEAELTALVVPRLRLQASGTLLDARYDNLQAPNPIYPELGVLQPNGSRLVNAAGNYLVRAPKLQFNVSGAYTAPITPRLNLVLTGAYAWQSRVYFDLFNNPLVSQPAYGVLDVSVGLQTVDGHWHLTGFVKNATDTFYRTTVNTSVLGAVPAAATTIGRPRTFGASLGYRF